MDTRTMMMRLAEVLAGLTWPVPEAPEPPEGEDPPPAPDPVPVFGAVAFYDSGRVQEAVDALYDYSDAMAVIVPASDAYRCEDGCGSLVVKQEVEIDIYLTGRAWDPTTRIHEFMGLLQSGSGWVLNEDDPGMIARKDAVVLAVAAKTLGGILYRPLAPVRAVPLTLDGDSGLRKSYLITFRADADDASLPIT